MKTNHGNLFDIGPFSAACRGYFVGEVWLFPRARVAL